MKWMTAFAAGLVIMTAQVLAENIKLTTYQSWALDEAGRAGDANDDGHPMDFNFVATFQAIVGQESSYCVDKHHRDPLSWGCGQLTVKTARLFDASATAQRLYHDDRYNIWLSATYLAYCRKHTPDWTQMVRCYKGRDTKHWQEYVEAIRRRLKDLPVSED